MHSAYVVSLADMFAVRWRVPGRLAGRGDPENATFTGARDAKTYASHVDDDAPHAVVFILHILRFLHSVRRRIL